MARCCGQTGTCACKIEAGVNTLVRGTGSSQDPFVVETDVALAAEDNSVFDLGLSGNGTKEFPWVLEVQYASTAELNDLPDVDVGAATDRANGRVLGWNTARQLFELQPPTTAAAGSILHDSSLTGDGSTGSLLQVNEDPARYLATSGAGLGLSDAGVNRMLRRYADATARGTATPAPDLNTVSVLDSRPGVVEYYDGSAWLPVESRIGVDFATGGQLMQMSGPYAQGMRIYHYARIFTRTTGSDGTFSVIPNTDIASRAGVLSCFVQPYGLLSTVPWQAIVVPAAPPGADRINGKAYRLSDGAAHANQAISFIVMAMLY